MAKPKTRAEKLFSAAVVRRSFQLQDKDYQAGFRFVYEGVLRDLGLTEAEVDAYLEEHRSEVEAAIGRRGQGGRGGTEPDVGAVDDLDDADDADE